MYVYVCLRVYLYVSVIKKGHQNNQPVEIIGGPCQPVAYYPELGPDSSSVVVVVVVVEGMGVVEDDADMAVVAAAVEM